MAAVAVAVTVLEVIAVVRVVFAVVVGFTFAAVAVDVVVVVVDRFFLKGGRHQPGFFSIGEKKTKRRNFLNFSKHFSGPFDQRRIAKK